MTIDARQAGQAGAGQARGMQCRGPFVPGGASALYLNMALLFCIASQDEVRLLLLSLHLLFALRNGGPHVGMASGTDT
jgi:hypothetical protein